jgi:hypothetical protein
MLWPQIKQLEDFDLHSMQRDFGHITQLRTMASIFNLSLEDFETIRYKFYMWAFNRPPQ